MGGGLGAAQEAGTVCVRCVSLREQPLAVLDREQVSIHLSLEITTKPEGIHIELSGLPPASPFLRKGP